MPHLPPPSPPDTTLYARQDTGGGVTNYFYVDGSFAFSRQEALINDTAWISHKSLLVRNKYRQLSPGTLWSPCASYSRSATTNTPKSGSIVRMWKGTNMLHSVYEGTPFRGGLAYVGPFMSGSAWAPNPIPTNVLNRLNTELLLKVGDKKASYGEALAEAGKAVNHLAHTATSVVSALLAARRGNWAGVAKALGVSRRKVLSGSTLSSRWLEYSYAWLPLISDIHDTHKLITEGFRKATPIMSSSRSLSDSHTASGPPPSGISVLTGASFVNYKAKVYYRVNDSTLAKWNQVGLINPLYVAWAVVPYSFVVDWFLPVGNFLEALTATIGVDFIDGYYGNRVTGGYQSIMKADNGNADTVTNTVGTQTDIFGYTRTRMTNFPTPGLYLKSPFSTSHVVSALALLHQLKR